MALLSRSLSASGRAAFFASGVTPTLLIVSLLCTGASGLIYQVVWFRLLGLSFGVTIQATSAVLAAFMAGLALGSLVAARYTDRLAAPLRVYGGIEIAVGLCGLVSLAALDSLTPMYQSLGRLAPDNVTAVSALRFVVAFVLLLLPTTLMGATLPLVVHGLRQRGGNFGGTVSALYAANTFGAIVGAYLAGFYFIGLLGLNGAVVIAATLNLVVGALWMVVGSGEARVATPQARVAAVAERPLSRRVSAAVLVVYGVSGAIALAYEVVWTRVLAGIFPGNTYSFTLMLCAVLAGIAIGSWAIGPWLSRSANWLLVFAALEAAMGLTALLSLYTLGQAYRLEASLRAMFGLADHVQLGETWFMVLFASLAIVPTAFLMGVTFPVAAKVYAAGHADDGRRVGRIYGVNTIGAIVGSLAGGLVLIPMFGAQHALWLLAVGNVVLAIVMVTLTPVSVRLRVSLSAVVVALSTVIVVATPDMYRSLFATIPWNEETIWHHEGPDATVRVAQYKSDGTRVLYINSEHQGTDRGSGLHFHYRLGHLGMLLHPEPREVLVIGMGVGATPGAAAVHPGAHVTVIELFPGVMEAARLFSHANYHVLDRPNVSLHVNDGRNFLLMSSQKYDVIETDPILPTNAGAGILYSADFYKLARQSLKEDGVMVQWLNDTLPGPAYRMMLRAFLEAFPYATLWNNGTILVGSPQPIAIDLEDLQSRFADPEVREALATIDIRSAGDVLRSYTAGPDELRAFAGPGPHVSDHFPAVEYVRTIAFDGTNADPQWSRLAQHIAARRQPNDGIVFGEHVVRAALAPHLKSALPELVLPPSVEGRERAVANDLAAFVAGRDRVWFLPWWQSAGDILVEHWLVSNAYLADDRTIAGQRAMLFATAKTEVVQQPSSVRFGEVFDLVRVGYDASPAQPGDIVRVALTWRARSALDRDYRTLVRLVNDSGVTLAASDRLPANAPTDGLVRGQTLNDRIGVLIPPGTPPGTYRVLLDVYRVDGGARVPAENVPAQQAIIGEVTVRPTERLFAPGAIEAATPLVVPFGSTNLIGYTMLGGTRQPGDIVPVTLYWQAQQPRGSGSRARLVVGEPNAPIGVSDIATASEDGRAGAIARVDASVWIRPDARAARYGVWLVVDGHPPLRLGGVRVAPRAAIVPPAPPAAILDAAIGPDLRLVGATTRSVPAGLEVEIVWTAVREQPVNYAAFVHLIDAEGRIIAQSDRVPGGVPTNRWRADERVGDRHVLSAPSNLGAALVIGLYDPVTLRRLGATTMPLP